MYIIADTNFTSFGKKLSVKNVNRLLLLYAVFKLIYIFHFILIKICVYFSRCLTRKLHKQYFHLQFLHINKFLHINIYFYKKYRYKIHK